MKASFRTLLILKTGNAIVITQDKRRRKNVITGMVMVEKLSSHPFNSYNAKALGCDIVVREK